MNIPMKIRDIIGKKRGIKDRTGMSGASVVLFDDMVLKVQNRCSESENEHRMMRWLDGKLPVPKIIEYSETNKYSHLLMTKCSGKSACSDVMLANPRVLCELLAETLNRVWCVDCYDCPTVNSLDRKLQQAEYNVINGLVDTQNCELETFGDCGFKDPETLLYWLQNNRPEETLVLSHGDFCLPNVFFNNGELSGLIDIGRAGIADKYCDIALCYRSLRNNYSGRYTGHSVPGFNESCFFDALQINLDWDRMRYYMLLDELF